MKIEEFDEETRKLEKFYDKDIPDEQRKIWYEEFKGINITRYKYLISQVYRKCKFMPKLADMIETNKSIGYMQEKEQEQKKEITKCNKCKGTGFIFYKKQEGNLWYDYVCRCNCVNGYQINKAIPTEQQLGIEE